MYFLPNSVLQVNEVAFFTYLDFESTFSDFLKIIKQCIILIRNDENTEHTRIKIQYIAILICQKGKVMYIYLLGGFKME